MTFDGFALRTSLLALLFVVTGCSSGPSSKTPELGPDGIEGSPLKISYFRFQREEAKGRLQSAFYVMLSYGWKARFGQSAHEPFERITRNVFKNVEIADGNMEKIIQAMKEKGWDLLPATDVSKIDVQRIAKLDKEAGTSADVVGPLRWLTISDGKTTKTVSNEDAFRAGPAMHHTYIQCEVTAFQVAMAMTAKVSVTADPNSDPTTRPPKR